MQKYNIIKPLENSIAENLDELMYGNDFLDISPKPWSLREITDKTDFTKLKELLLCEW